MNITSVGNNLNDYYTQLSTGKQVNSAADNASGLAVSEKLEAQSNAYDIGADNASSAIDMIKIADGALSTITDSLQRIKELSIQAANGIYGESELSIFQDEINSLKDFISGVLEGTEYNKKTLFDGSMDGANVAVNPDGSGSALKMPNLYDSLSALKDYDVTGDFDISIIDSAINTVSLYRGSMGAKSNALESTVNYNQNASYNTTTAQSRIKDTDIADKITELKKQQTLQDIRLHMLKKKKEGDENNNPVLKLLNASAVNNIK